MFSSQCAGLFALVINFQHVWGYMVRSVDGSFVPLSLEARAGGGIGVLMSNNHDMAYLATVQIGTPPQEIPMAVSLSQNFVTVESPPGGVSNPSYYNSSISTSYTPINNQSASVTTISGDTATGLFASEMCTLQSATSDATFPYPASIVVTDPSVTTDLFPPGSRAILGYGVNTPVGSPPNSSMLVTFLPPNFGNAVCGIELNHFNDPYPDGILMMGSVDTTAFTGEFTNVMVPPNATVSWSIPIDTITYLSSATNSLQGVPGGLVSVDMYHSVIQVSDVIANQIYSNTTGAQPISATQWSIPCNATFPIQLTFGGTPFTILERDTIIHTSYGTCIGVVTGGATAAGGKVGAPFMRNVYTQFAATQTADGGLDFSVGFAQKVQRQSSVIPLTPTTTAAPTPVVQSTISVNPSTTSTTTTTKSGARVTIHSSPAMLGLMVVSIAVMLLF